MEIFIHRKPRAIDQDTAGVFWSELDTSYFPVKKVQNVEAVKESIQNILRTMFGERFFNVEFGSGFSSALFEPLDKTTASTYKSSIVSAINRWEPRVEVNSARTRLFSNGNDGNVYLELSYYLRGDKSYTNYTSTFIL